MGLMFRSRKQLAITLAALVPFAAIVDMLILKAIFGDSVAVFANAVIIGGAAVGVAVSTGLGVANILEAKRDADDLRRGKEQAEESDYSDEYYEGDSEEMV